MRIAARQILQLGAAVIVFSLVQKHLSRSMVMATLLVTGTAGQIRFICANLK